MKTFRQFLLLLLLSLPLVAAAQVDLGSDVEQWLEDGGSSTAGEQLADLIESLREKPVNINDTNDLRLQELGFLTPFQTVALKVYIQRYGRLSSLGELYFVAGFDSSAVKRLEPLVVVEPVPVTGRLNISNLLAHPHLHWLAGVTATVPELDADDPLRFYSRLRVDFSDKVQLQLSADRDPGERLLGGDDFYSGHLILNNLGRLRRFVVGRYNLQFGQGLALWTGFAPFSMVGQSPFRLAQGIRPASAFAESGYLQGVAATVDILRGLEATAFYSSDAGDRLGGANVTYRAGGLKVGLTAAYLSLADSATPRNYPYNFYAFRGKDCQNVSLDAAWTWRNVLIFAEAAFDGDGSPAAIAGARFLAGSSTTFGITGRHYASGYYAPYAAAAGLQSNTANEQGVRLDFSTELPTRTTLLATADIARFPYLRYGAYSPTNGADIRMQINQPIGSKVKLSVRYRHRLKERNGVVEPQPNYLTEQTVRRQFQADLTYGDGEWQTLTRVQYILFMCEMHDDVHGILLAQDLRYRPQRLPLSFVARVALFDAEAYDAAIYMSESDLAYNFSTPMLLHQGLRMYLVASYDVGKHVNISAKYAFTARGSDEDIHTFKIMLRMNF
ncbi:MAG: hypothetical protein K6F85_02775 [Bacteroidales bacterium]|nr:hypothetical protein [Bacteroidales bacterium]